MKIHLEPFELFSYPSWWRQLYCPALHHTVLYDMREHLGNNHTHLTHIHINTCSFTAVL